MSISRFTIRTSDRRVFRRCLRKWDWISSMRQNLTREGTEQNLNFWFGSAIHFALEDYHAYNKFGDPRRAFKAYYEAFKADTLPEGAGAAYDLGIGMLTYYIEWYDKHNKDFEFETLWLDEFNRPQIPGTPGAKPATEIRFFLDLSIKVIVDVRTEKIIKEYVPGDDDIKLRKVSAFNFGTEPDIMYYTPDLAEDTIEVQIVPIHYHGTIDRVVVDKFGRWWLLDYKTAKSADTNKLDTDDQISAYIWAMEQYLQHPLYGFVYLQLTKAVARTPRRLKNGELSVDKKQRTTYALVKSTLIKEFGSIQKTPNKYVEFLNHFVEQETPEGDKFIRWDYVPRTRNQIISTYYHIMGEVRAMINPNLYTYPNPTRDCIWDCPLRDTCIALDDGRMDDVNFTLTNTFVKRKREEDGGSSDEAWRKNLKYPAEQLGLATEEEFALDLEGMDIVIPDELDDVIGGMFGE